MRERWHACQRDSVGQRTRVLEIESFAEADSYSNKGPTREPAAGHRGWVPPEFTPPFQPAPQELGLGLSTFQYQENPRIPRISH